MTERFFHAYLSGHKPFKNYWNYEDGCLLLGCKRMFEATGRAEYAEFVLRYLSQRVEPDGVIPESRGPARGTDPVTPADAERLLLAQADLSRPGLDRRDLHGSPVFCGICCRHR